MDTGGANPQRLTYSPENITSVNPVWRKGQTTHIININSTVPETFKLFQNYPNPFNPATNIKFNVKQFGDVKVTVYDVMGREVQTFVNESLKPGTYVTMFEGSKLNSGVYYCKLSSETFTETKKMLLTK